MIVTNIVHLFMRSLRILYHTTSPSVPQGYYERTPDYMPIVKWEKRGCFPVAMVHSTLLIHLFAPSAASLAYAPPPPGYAGPTDDIIIFAHSARHAGIAMHIVNRDLYGFMLLPVTHVDGRDTDVDDHEQFVHMKIENISEYRVIPPCFYACLFA